MWAKVDRYGSTMKWHLAEEESLEIREVDEGWSNYPKIMNKRFVHICCAFKHHDVHIKTYLIMLEKAPEWADGQFWTKAKIRDKVNVFQNNVCSYCRNYVLRQEHIEAKLER